MTPLNKAASFVSIFIILLALNSCKMARISPFLKPVETSLSHMSGKVEDFLADPFSNKELVPLIQSATSMTMFKFRSKPASAVTGRRLLTLADCRALAVASSLEIEKVRIEEISRRAVEFSNRTRMMPHVILAGELSERDNLAFSYSEILGREGVIPQPGSTGEGVNQFSTGRERGTFRYTLESRWSPTDAALAYYLTKTSRNEGDKKRFMRIRVTQRLFGVVDASFQRLLTLQETVPMGERLLSIRKTVAAKMENLFHDRLAAAEEYHQSTQKLITAERLVARLSNETERQRNLLASAMQLSPEYGKNCGFHLVGEVRAPDFRDDICTMELVAVKNRPEAYTAGLDHLNSLHDLRRTIIKYFPKVTGSWKYTRDNDKHLYNRDWKELGVEVYFDLVDWCSNLWESKATVEETRKTYNEIGVVALAITSEVRAAALKYYDAIDQLRSADRALASSEKLLAIMRTRASQDALKRLALLEVRGDVLGQTIEKIHAVGEAQAALAELQAAMGINYREPSVPH